MQTEEAAVKLVNETLEGDYGLLDTAELKALVDSDEAFLLVDAMPAADSYDRGHIEGAVNFEFDKEVIDRWSDEDLQGPRAEAFVQLLGEDKERKLVMYCGFVKCARSHNAAVMARKLGYTNVFRYPGGIYAWQGAGHPLTTE